MGVKTIPEIFRNLSKLSQDYPMLSYSLRQPETVLKVITLRPAKSSADKGVYEGINVYSFKDFSTKLRTLPQKSLMLSFKKSAKPNSALLEPAS